MKIKKIPKRTCVITRESFEKRELLRIVRTPEGNVIYDETGKNNGRGAYLKRDIAVIEKAKKNKILNKILDIEVPVELYDQIIDKIK